MAILKHVLFLLQPCVSEFKMRNEFLVSMYIMISMTFFFVERGCFEMFTPSLFPLDSFGGGLRKQTRSRAFLVLKWAMFNIGFH